jgi:hypothetical protein
MGRTDFTPRDLFKKRALHHLHEKTVGTSTVFKVNYNSNFDEFAASVAFALRTMIVYRTDGGRFARGLVRATGDLQNIHADLRGTKVPDGSPVRLIARLYRRRDPIAANRWVMSIQFAHVTEDVIHGDKDDPVVASPDVTDNSNKHFTETVLHHAIVLFGDRHKFPGDRGDRIRKWLEIADRLGYPRNWNMWYYNRPAVYSYIRWESSQPNEDTNPNSKRRRMTAAAGGRMPFEGKTNTGLDWRVYPFRNAAWQCRGSGPDLCTNTLANELIHDEDEIFRTYADISKEIGRVSNVPSWSVTTNYASSLGPLAFDFLKHIYALGKDPDTLYSVYPPPDSFWFGTVGP